MKKFSNFRSDHDHDIGHNARSEVSLFGLAFSHAVKTNSQSVSIKNGLFGFLICSHWATVFANPSLCTMLHPAGFHVLRFGLDPPSRHPVEESKLPRFDEQRLCRFEIGFIIFLCQLLLFITRVC